MVFLLSYDPRCTNWYLASTPLLEMIELIRSLRSPRPSFYIQFFSSYLWPLSSSLIWDTKMGKGNGSTSLSFGRPCLGSRLAYRQSALSITNYRIQESKWAFKDKWMQVRRNPCDSICTTECGNWRDQDEQSRESGALKLTRMTLFLYKYLPGRDISSLSRPL